MCRFVAYLGTEFILLDEVLEKPVNSLINQSKKARSGTHGLNADGFGIGWYNHSIDSTPGMFKSIQPAWNDEQLDDLCSKLKSTCFIGHVRASTVGDITALNCHPFRYQNYLFAHNGTIRDFHLIKKELIKELSDEAFANVRGQTDSEYFFALILTYLDKNADFIPASKAAITRAIAKIHSLKSKVGSTEYTRLNVIFTDGIQLVVTRYATPEEIQPLSLYYAIGAFIKHKDGTLTRQTKNIKRLRKKAILLASEPLTDFLNEWQEVPYNHVLSINKNFVVTIDKI